MLSGSSSDCLCCFFYRAEDEACHNIISHRPPDVRGYKRRRHARGAPGTRPPPRFSRPDFSAFVKAAPDVTPIFSGPTNGGEEAEIRRVCRQSRGGFITVLKRRAITMYHASANRR